MNTGEIITSRPRRVGISNQSFAAALGLCGMLAAGPALAADRIWTGGDVDDDNWSSPDNWGGTAPVAGDKLIFTGSIRPTPYNDFVLTTAFGGLQFGADAAAFTFSGVTIRMNYNIAFTGEPGSPVTHTFTQGFLIAAANRQITTRANGAIMINGAVTDGGNNRILTKAGEGALTLNGANTFGGQLRIDAGVLNANSIADATQTSSLGKGGANAVIRIGEGANTASLAYTGAAPASTDRQVQIGNGTTSASTGGANIANNIANPAHTLSFSNSTFNAANTSAIAPRRLTLEGSNTGLNTISGAIIDNAAAAKINLTKADGGTWALGGANSYTGTTSIDDGTLLVNGSLADTAVTVAGGATLGGSGTVGTLSALNTLTVNGTLAPGNSTGILTVNDNLDLNGTLSAELNGTTAGSSHDQVAVNGALDVTGSTLSAAFGSFTPVDGDRIFIAVNDGTDPVTGTFSGFAQDAVVAYYRGFYWKISYHADSVGDTFNGGNDIALMAVSDGSVTVSSWTFDTGADPNARLASSGTATGLTVSQLNFHPTFDGVPTLVNNEETTLNGYSTHDRWAADGGIGILRMRRADYLQGTAPSGRSATYNSTTTSTSGDAGTLGAPIWFSVTTDAQTNATISAISISNPGGGSAATYHFAKSGDPLGTGVTDTQPTIHLSSPVTLGASQTVYFSVNIDSAATATNNNINQVTLLGTTEALPPPIGLVTGTLTVGAPHGTYNRLTVNVDPGPLDDSTDTSNLTGTVDLTVNIDPDTGKTALLTLSNGRVNGTNMSFVKTSIIPQLAYDIQATGLSAAVNTLVPPGTVDPNTGVFAANQHGFILDQGAFTGTAAGEPFSETLSPTNSFSGAGTGNGSLTLTPAGTSGPYNLFNAVVILPVAINESIISSGVTTVITGTGTVKATGQIQMPSSEFNAWMIDQGATSFDPTADTARNGAPDAIKWALGLDLFDNPLPFLLKPHPSIPGSFTISLPPGGTVAPLTVESSPTLLPPWTPIPAGQLVPNGNPIPAGSTAEIQVTPSSATEKLFLRLRADP